MNTNHNIEKIVAEYADKIFGFCINRLNNIDDAQDLSQDIMLEVIRCLPKSSIIDINAWIWKVAYNRYAMYINKKKHNIVSFDDSNIIDTLVDERNYFTEDNTDETNAAFSALHSLAKSHRDILVDYYVNELSCFEIAVKHKLSVNTVNTRLFYGRQKLKERWQTIMNENKIYEKIKWSLNVNGDITPYQYLSRQVSRAIAKAAYEKSLSPTEISISTGIPCMYIEDELQNLLDGEVLTETNGKYATNFIIHSAEFLKCARALVNKAGTDADLTNKIVQVLDKYDKQIREIKFIGNDKPKNELWWLMIPLVIQQAAKKVRSLSGLECPLYPPRYDGSYGWFAIQELLKNENEDEISEYSAGCNSYHRAKNIARYYWVGKYYSYDINDYFGRKNIDEIITSIPDIDRTVLDDEELAEGIKYNLIEKTAEGYKWSLMFFTEEQIKKLETLVEKMANEISDFSNNLSKALLEIYEMYKTTTPKRLHDQIKGVIGGIKNGTESIVCDMLEQNGTLAKPDNEYFTKQIIVIRK